MATFKDTDTFLINRDGVDYQVSFAELAAAIDEIQNPLPPPPWDDHDGGVFHLKNATETVKFNNNNGSQYAYPAYDLKGNYLGAKSLIGPDEEFVILTGEDCSSLFLSGRYETNGSWEFGKYTDTSKVTNMRFMFNNCGDFNSDIGNWDTSNVTNMQSTFNVARSFNQDVSGWNTAKVTHMTAMFGAANAFNQDLSQWDVSKVVSMAVMLSATNISVENYDKLLIGWSKQAVQDNVKLDAANLKYSPGEAAEARQKLIDEHNQG